MEEAAGLGAALVTLLIACLLLGMHHSINSWLLPLLQGLQHPSGSFLRRAALWPIARAARGGEWIVNYVDHHVSKAASHLTAPLAHWIGGLAAQITAGAYAAGGFSLEVARGFERLVAHTIPHEIHAATRPLWRGIDHLERDFHHLRERLRAFERGIDRLVAHRIMPAIRWLRHEVAVALPRDIAGVRHRLGSVETQLRKPSRVWLRRLSRLLWAAGLFGLVVKTLARRFPWLFCRKTKVVGNRLCSLDQDLLNALIAETLLIAGAISVVEFAKSVNGFLGVAMPLIRDFVRELSGLAPADYLRSGAASTSLNASDYLG